MITLTNIKKIYTEVGIDTVALNGINLKVEDGDFVAIMGPSGCGKSTLLNIIGLLDTPTDGNLNINGIECSNLKENVRTKLRKGAIGFVFQSFNLIGDLTVAQNIELPLKYLGVGRKEREMRTMEIMRQLKISHRRDFYPHQLSGGQQQLVAIARALVTNPKIVLADEPTGNIDSTMGQQIMELLTEINTTNNVTILVATHNEKDASYAHHIINLFDGSIVAISNSLKKLNDYE